VASIQPGGGAPSETLIGEAVAALADARNLGGHRVISALMAAGV
jgi:hypothetical protein